MCAHAVSVALKGVAGVESVDVSLGEGVATIALAPANEVTVEQVREIVRDNGFSPKETEVRVVGRLVADPAGLMLAAAGTAQPFELREHPDAAGVLDRLRDTGLAGGVVIAGVVPESAAADPPVRVILVRAFSEPAS